MLSFTGENGIASVFSVQSRPTRLPEGRTIITGTLAPVLPGVDPMLSNWSSEARLISLLDVLPVYVAIVDQDRTIRYDNKMFRQLFGKGRGRKCHEVMRGRTAPCPSCGPLTVIATQAVAISEWASEKLHNAFRVHSYPCIDPQGNKAVLKVGLNITAGVRAQNALDLSEQRYRSITDNLTVGIALVDPLLNVVTANPRLSEWFGQDAVKNASICDLMRRRCEGESNGCAACLFRKSMEDGKTHEREFSLMTRGGGSRHFRQVVCPIVSRRKETRGTLMMLEDTTERHNITAQMQQMRRLEAMGSLAGGIAHEINQPLSALHLYAGGLQMLLEQGGTVSPERVLDRLGLILKQADKIREIIDHMRALVMQEESAPPSPVSLHESVTGALNLVGAQLTAHNLTVHVALPRTLPLVLANPVQLEQVFINLLINAMHALDTVDTPGKEIRIEPGVSEPGLIRIRVVDNGPGVQGLEDKIFDPFFTTKESHLGMGLGLSIVHTFVHSWGGEIRARSNGTKPGASFTITMKTA
jgi:PAS domain S-box-containing protein